MAMLLSLLAANGRADPCRVTFQQVFSGHNDLEIRVHAMARSGHHAVMNWMLKHFDGAVYFLINCSFIGCSSYYAGAARGGHGALTEHSPERVFTGTASEFH